MSRVEIIKADEGKKRGTPAADASSEALRRQDRLAKLGILSASMAHEIKNALVAGKTYIDLLLEKQKDDQLAGVVRRELDRVDVLVSHILRYSGTSPTDFHQLSLHDVLEHSLRLVQPRLEGQALHLQKDLAAVPDLIEGSDYQLEQAFVNLLLNAIDAMTRNGVLAVSTRFVSANQNGRGSVRLIISDTGSGISEPNLERLFQPFFTTKKTGTGLGLAITQGIIHEHHASISVKSRVREGTEFLIDFPALLR